MLTKSPKTQVPPELEDAGFVMSNYDHEIDREIEAILLKGKHGARYAGWDFCGTVWRAGDKWKCEIWVYQSPREVVEADTLEEIMELVSEKYGAN